MADKPTVRLKAKDPSWHHYPQTVLAFHADTPFEIDLRRPLGTAVLAALKRAGLGGSCAVVTACDPVGKRASKRENALRTNTLRAVIALFGVCSVQVDGMSPDRRHVEQGFAVVLPKQEARRIAVFFGQTAFFWFDGKRFWLEPSGLDRHSVALPIPEPHRVDQKARRAKRS